MSLEIQAFSGMRSGVSNPGWNPTNAAFFLAVLRAMYGDAFGWPEIEKFKELNEIEDWQPNEDLSADGLLLSGTIYTPDGFDLSGWADYYADWKAGNLDVSLPPEVVYESTVEYVPDNIGWSPAQTTVLPQSPSSAAATTVANSAQSAVNVSQPATVTPPKKKTESGLPGWVWLAGGVGLLAVGSMVFGKKGRR